MLIGGLDSTVLADGSRAATDATSLQEELNRFLTLLVTQLEHQDPLDPMDANEFTQQLVQFASVEQQIQQNANLETLVAAQQNTQTAALVGYLGTLAEVGGSALPLDQDGAQATYTLSDNAAATVTVVKNASGQPVFTAEGSPQAGTHTFRWDGVDNSGQRLPNGTYTLDILAKRRDGTSVDVTQSAFGRVTAAAADGDSVRLFLGHLAVGVDEVLSVREAPSLPAADTQ